MAERESKRQQKAAATAEQLVNAAREVFETKGYQGSTVGAITEAANCAHGTFYLYFRNKEDVFAKVMAQVTKEMYEEARAPWEGDPYQALYSATRGYLEVYRAHKGLWRCLLEGMHQSKAVEDMWLDLRRPFVERIARNLTRLGDAGAIRPLNANLAAHSLGSMVEWTSFAHFELNEPPAEDVTLDELALTLTDLWFHAVYTDRSNVVPAGVGPPDRESLHHNA
jgi:AcrR family transcriptional regulator